MVYHGDANYPLPKPLTLPYPFPLRLWAVRHAQFNKGMAPSFEEHIRCLMATGSTARQARESLILSAAHFLGPLPTPLLIPMPLHMPIPMPCPLPYSLRVSLRCSRRGCILPRNTETRLVRETAGSVGSGIIPLYLHENCSLR